MPPKTPPFPSLPVSPGLTFEQQVRLLRGKIGLLRREITEIATKGNEAQIRPCEVNMFRGMFRTVDAAYQKAQQTWDSLLELYVVNNKEDEFPSLNDTANFEAIKESYYEYNYVFESLKPTPQAPVLPSLDLSNITVQHVNSSKTHLPDLNIPTFSGNLSEWITYRDTFKSMVHNDPVPTDMAKFHYLVGSLSGEAKKVIKSIELKESNYNQAWEALLSHYDNKRRLASNHLQQLFNFKPIEGRPTAANLNEFLLTVGESITSFENLNIANPGKFILFEIAIKCLDQGTRQAFEYENAEVDFPTFDMLRKFVKKKALALSLAGPLHSSSSKPSSHHKPIKQPNKYQPKTTPPSSTGTTLVATPGPPPQQNRPFQNQSPSERKPFQCYVCKGPHTICQCSNYNSATPAQRWEMLKHFKGCTNCLSLYHKKQQCNSTFRCRLCSKDHHTSLHLDRPAQSTSSASNQSPPAGTNRSTVNQPTTTHVCNQVTANTSKTSEVLLSTVLAQIKDSSGNFQPITMLIDSASQQSLILKSCADRLGLKPKGPNRTISGLSQALTTVEGSILCTLRPSGDQPSIFQTEAMVLKDSMTPLLPQQALPEHLIKEYLNYNLADPEFYRPNEIEFILGAALYVEIVQGPPIKIKDGAPHIMQTAFGIVLLGEFTRDTPHSHSVSLAVTDHQDIGNIIKSFWEVEEVCAPTINWSVEELKCDDHYNNTTYRLENGRYVVSLPFRDNAILGPSKPMALKRLYALERKLSRDPELAEEYRKFMKEYEDLGHMRPTREPASYIIPHHAIIRRDKPTSKLRVVFDASASTSNGSLNDHLLVGPKLQADICDIMLNFRRYPVVFVTDVVKMYRQILVREEDRRYQHILWRPHPDREVQEYELMTVTYGLSCAPYQALKTFKRAASDEMDKYPLAAHVLANDAYMDDVVTGAFSLSEALTLKEQLINLLSSCGFELSKWASNCDELISSTTETSNTEPFIIPDEGNVSIKILGLRWNPVQDVFFYQVEPPEFVPTKRSILSNIARIYDPLGYLAPSIFYAKTILQLTWLAKIDWDDSVSENIAQLWEEFILDLRNIEKISIPRYLLPHVDSENHIVGFCDASQRGYCAVLYLRSEHAGLTKVSLLKSKTKLAPTKPMTVPRLELCGALLLCELLKSIYKLRSSLNIEKITLFTDSTIVLCWLRSDPSLLKTFVQHRIVKIH